MKRIPSLDFLRGISALSVVYYHVLIHLSNSKMVAKSLAIWAFTEVVALGQVGVVVFFAISGFVIPYSLKSTSASPLADFAKARFFRLYPLYWLSIVLALLVSPAMPPLKTILANVTMMAQFAGQRDILSPYWTLQIELVFYVTCAALFAKGWLSRRSVVLMIAVLLLIVTTIASVIRGWLGTRLPLALPLGMSVMFFGFFWRGVVLEQQAEAKRASKIWLIAFMIMLPVICVAGYSKDTGFGETWHRYLLTYLVGLGIFIVFTKWMPVSNRIFNYLGKISYSIYLLHSVVIIFAQRFVEPLLTNVSSYAYALAIIAMTVLLSALSYAFIEKPCMNLGRKLKGKDPAALAQLSPP